MLENFKFMLGWLFNIYNPKFQLALSDIVCRKHLKSPIYVLKQYGTHETYELTYKDIVENKSILCSINPLEMMNIHFHAFNYMKEERTHRISEYLSGNKYEIICGEGSYCCDGSYICENMQSFKNLDVVDAMNIAYETGVVNTRRLTAKIKNEIHDKLEKEKKQFYESRKEKLRIVK